MLPEEIKTKVFVGVIEHLTQRIRPLESRTDKTNAPGTFAPGAVFCTFRLVPEL
jgi:hypothetical protein